MTDDKPEPTPPQTGTGTPMHGRSPERVDPKGIRYQVMPILSAGLAILAGSVLVAYFLNHSVGNEMIQAYQREQQVSVSLQSARLKDMIDHITHDLANLAAQLQAADFEEARSRERLKAFYQRHKGFVVAGYYMDRNGVLKYVEGEDRSGEGADISYQDHVKRLFENGTPVVSGSFKAVEGYLAMAIHTPIRERGRVSGSAATLVKWNAFGDWFRKAASSPGSFTMLIDSREKIIYHPDPRYSGRTLADSPPIIADGIRLLPEFFFSNQTAVVTGPFFEHRKFVMACHSFLVGDTTYTLVSCAPYANIVAPLKRLSQLTGLLTCLSFLVVILSVVYILRLFSVEKRKWLQFHAELRAEIEERKQVETALQQSEHRFRLLSEATSEAVAIYNHETLIEANDQFFDLFDYAPRDLIGQNAIALTTTEPTVAGIVADLASRPQAPALLTGITRSGTQFPIEARIKTLNKGDRHLVLLAITDISDRLKAEQALRESEERYRRFFQEDLSGAFISRPDGRIIACNPAFARMFGFASQSEIKNTDLNTIYPGPSVREQFLSLLKRERFLERYESTMRRQDGSLIHTIENSVGVFDENDELVEIRGYLMDVTERKKLESQLRQSQKMEAIGTLAGGIAHDFNNILASVIGFCELGMGDADRDSDLYDNILEAYLAAIRAKDLVKQILTFARQSDSERKPVRVKLILKEAMKFLRSSLPTTIDIHQHLNSEASILANPTQLHQIIMNLCTNASHAMQQNGGRLTVKLEGVMLSDEDRQRLGNIPLAAGQYMRMSVSDTGSGFSPEIAERIFDPYFTTKAPGEGTGMGLSVVQGIVHGCGGAITVESQPGKGSTFSVYFPQLDDEEEGGEGSQHLYQLPTGSEHILLVDDEAALTKMGRRMLESLGYRVSTSNDSIEALESFRSAPQAIDLVVTDMTMPGLTGDKLAEKMRAVRPDLPIIILTGFSDNMTSKTAQSAGFQGFLMKPVVKSDLARLLRNALDSKAAGVT